MTENKNGGWNIEKKDVGYLVIEMKYRPLDVLIPNSFGVLVDLISNIVGVNSEYSLLPTISIFFQLRISISPDVSPMRTCSSSSLQRVVT